MFTFFMPTPASWQIDFYDKQCSIVDRFAGFHVDEACARAGEDEGGAVAVRVDLIVIDAFHLVVFHVIKSYVEWCAVWADLAPDMDDVAYISTDVL